jgi:hypothetical protein
MVCGDMAFGAVAIHGRCLSVRARLGLGRRRRDFRPEWAIHLLDAVRTWHFWYMVPSCALSFNQ